MLRTCNAKFLFFSAFSISVDKMVKNPSVIKNKVKRTAMYAKYKQQKKKLKKKLREERVAEVEALGEAAPPKQIPKTIENTRELDETLVQPDDEEIAGDEQDDEFAKYFTNETKPKIMITTRPKCSRKLFPFIGDLMQMIPNAFYYPRGKYVLTLLCCSLFHSLILNHTGKHLVKDLAQYAANKEFTHLVILTEKQKECNGLLITHLPCGPTAFLKVSCNTILPLNWAG